MCNRKESICMPSLKGAFISCSRVCRGRLGRHAVALRSPAVLRASILLLLVGLCLAGPALSQSTEPSSAAKPISPETIALSADFEGQLDRGVNTAYFCKGIANFVAA